MKSIPHLRHCIAPLALAIAWLAAACGGASASSPATATTTPASPAVNGSSASVANSAAPSVTAVGEVPPEFPSIDPNRWVNGAPTTLASARGDVVLVESWHRL